MADLQKIISANDINQASSVVGLQRGGATVTIVKLDADFVNQLSIEAIESGYDNRFDDYGLRRKTIEMGDWNMDATASLEVAHGLSSNGWQGMRSIEVSVRNDADSVYYDADQSALHMSVSGIDSSNVTLERASTGLFDGTDFDATSYNRGWVTVWYE